ncbi:MAG TPA: MarC family protein [Casimicrobiaceae bacterium]|jgi:multiple antibiotic resistance protein|nr:MarC family protein [Casimicrobiaceae bacterium]
MLADARQFLETMLLAVAALLPIVNPVAGASVFLAKTADLAPDERHRAAMRVARYGFTLLLASAFIGAYVLDFFGLSVPIVQVAGGLVVSVLGWTLLSQEDTVERVARDAAATPTPDDLGSRAFYPLTMPLTVGPGSISVAITLGANPPSGARALAVTVAAHAIGLAIVALVIYLVYAKADVVLRKLGPTGAVIVTRLSAFILLCVGVQIVWNGVRALLLSLAA